ncbi:hypothetical protein E2C01_083745 [Portunus trituberculatus]|uniref:Uncharacterized protein n=1 Tax=Portunus trituberculatus TaxID=210409 RepID=A0A5B7J8U4_PORTR|nr:hypothetical protein [Portunus trituberculatus]
MCVGGIKEVREARREGRLARARGSWDRRRDTNEGQANVMNQDISKGEEDEKYAGAEIRYSKTSKANNQLSDAEYRYLCGWRRF